MSERSARIATSLTRSLGSTVDAMLFDQCRDTLDKPLLVILGDVRARARRSGSNDHRAPAPSAISSAAIARPSAARAVWSFASAACTTLAISGQSWSGS